MHAAELVDRIGDVLDADERVLAVFLAGSHGRGEADEYSDVDVLVVVPEAAQQAFLADWNTLSDAIGTTVYRQRLGTAPVINHVTPEWLRYDVTVVTDVSIEGYPRDRVRPLRDPTGITDRLPAAGPPLAPDPAKVRAVTVEFLRVLGLLPVVLGRGEYACAVSGAGLLRTMLIALMTEDIAVPDRGGVLHLSRLLPPDRYAAITALPPVEATHSSTLAAHLACAELFLPLARDLAARCGAGYPEAMVDACRTHLRTALDVDLPG